MGSIGRWRLSHEWYPTQEWMKGRKYEPKSPSIHHAIKDKNQLVQIAEPDNARAAEMVWRPGGNKFRWSGVCIKGQGTTYLYPTNTWKVGHRSRYLKGVVWRWGERWSILGFPLKLLWGICPVWMAFHPKEVSMGWDHLMHAIGVGYEIALFLSIWIKQEQRGVRNKISNFVWKWRVVQPTHSEQR